MTSRPWPGAAPRAVLLAAALARPASRSLPPAAARHPGRTAPPPPRAGRARTCGCSPWTWTSSSCAGNGPSRSSPRSRRGASRRGASRGPARGLRPSPTACAGSPTSPPGPGPLSRPGTWCPTSPGRAGASPRGGSRCPTAGSTAGGWPSPRPARRCCAPNGARGRRAARGRATCWTGPRGRRRRPHRRARPAAVRPTSCPTARPRRPGSPPCSTAGRSHPQDGGAGGLRPPGAGVAAQRRRRRPRRGAARGGARTVGGRPHRAGRRAPHDDGPRRRRRPELAPADPGCGPGRPQPRAHPGTGPRRGPPGGEDPLLLLLTGTARAGAVPPPLRRVLGAAGRGDATAAAGADLTLEEVLDLVEVGGPKLAAAGIALRLPRHWTRKALTLSLSASAAQPGSSPTPRCARTTSSPSSGGPRSASSPSPRRS